MMNSLDATDRQILKILQTDGRISNVELAAQVGLSPSAAHARIRRLEQRGLIRQYAAILDREQMGYDMICFVNIGLQTHRRELVENFKTTIAQMPEVLECHHLTGEYDYLLKVVVRNRKDLHRFVVDNLTPIPGMAKIHTSVVLATEKDTTALPVA